MKYKTIVVEVKYGAGIIWMNRPDRRNALDGTMISELRTAMRSLEDDPTVHAIVLAGAGESFCAGLDMHWVERMANSNAKTRYADLLHFAALLQEINTFKKPTISRVHGYVSACGAGLVAACDIAVAAYDAEFCLSEVRLGLIPGFIGPYVVRAMGERAARRYFLSGECFTAAEAYRVGLVSELAPTGELDARINELLGHLLHGGSSAKTVTKDWILAMARTPVASDLIKDGAARFTAACDSDEGRQGIRAFMEKGRPVWRDQVIRSVIEDGGAPKATRRRNKATDGAPALRRRR